MSNLLLSLIKEDKHSRRTVNWRWIECQSRKQVNKTSSEADKKISHFLLENRGRASYREHKTKSSSQSITHANGNITWWSLAKATPATVAAEQNEFQLQVIVAISLAKRISAALEPHEIP